jgi:chemotaxis-related protein WspB
MSTRVIVVSLSTESGDGTRLLGLLAEQVTETLRQNEEDFRHSAGSNAPYLGRIAVQPVGMVQRIELKHLLPADVQRRLFQRDAQTV